MASPSPAPAIARTSFARVLVVMAILLGGVFVSPLGAHTEVFERAPVAGQPVGGVVDQINISFWSQVLTSNITVTGPDGAAIDVATTELTGPPTSGAVVTITLPLSPDPR